MKLWDMLDKTKYYQTVWIYETNAHDQNMPLFKGTANDARGDTDIVWDYLMCEVEIYSCENGVLDIRVRNENYNKRLESHYTVCSGGWGKNKADRPWRYSAEIDGEKQEV